MTITFPASDESLADATKFLEEQLELANATPKVAMQLGVALEELFVNIAHYAYPEEKNGKLSLSIEFVENTIVMVFIDAGIPFNPLEREDPDITLAADERAIGGLGIFMVKETMDSVEYKYENGQNILTIKKKL